VVKLTPTYSGCPAVIAIEMAVETALLTAELDSTIERNSSPAWTTDWISDERPRESCAALWHRPAG